MHARLEPLDGGPPFELVKDVYEEQFARLSADARITDYLVLFASRRTRDLLGNRQT